MKKNTYRKGMLHPLIALLLLVVVFALYHKVEANEQGTEAVFSYMNFPLPSGHVQFGSPSLADITGDGVPEILIGTTAKSCNEAGQCNYTAEPKLFVMKGDGSILWSRTLNSPINSAPSVGNIDGDPNNTMEIVITTGGDVGDPDHHGQVIAFDHQGNELWRFRTEDFYPKDGFSDGIFSAATLCDVDGDRKLEITFGAWDQRIYLLDHNGQSLWSNLPNDWPGMGFHNGDTIWSTPACADLNNDGYAEIITGADISSGGILPDGYQPQDGGFLYVFDRHGQILVRRHFPETIYSSPAVGDLDGDGRQEIVVGTGWYWWNQHGRTEQPYVYAFNTERVFSDLHYSDPQKLPDLPGWPRPTQYPGFSSPALADLDGDSDLEVVIGTGHPDLPNDDLPGAGQVYAWHHDGSPVSGWPVSPKDALNKDHQIFSSPTVADIDGDNQPEVLFTMLWDVQVYNVDGSFQELLHTRYSLFGSPAVGDTNGDGRAEVWIGGSDVLAPETGDLWRFESSVANLGPQPWPMFHRDATHAGSAFKPAALRLNRSELSLIYEKNKSSVKHGTITLSNVGDAPFSWEIESLPDQVQVTPTSGVIEGGAEVDLLVTLSGNVKPSADTILGDMQIDAITAEGDAVIGSPASTLLSLRVFSEVHQISLPLITR